MLTALRRVYHTHAEGQPASLVAYGNADPTVAVIDPQYSHVSFLRFPLFGSFAAVFFKMLGNIKRK